MCWKEKSVGSGKRGCYVKLSPDIKARFYSSATQTRYPSTITSTHNSLTIMTALSTEAELHVWCGLAIIKPWKFFAKSYPMANLRKFWSTKVSHLTGTFKPIILHKKPSRSLKKTFDLKNVPMEKLSKHRHNFSRHIVLLVVISFHVCFCRKHFTLANICMCILLCLCSYWICSGDVHLAWTNSSIYPTSDGSAGVPPPRHGPRSHSHTRNCL